jgi:hypothetical protein
MTVLEIGVASGAAARVVDGSEPSAAVARLRYVHRIARPLDSRRSPVPRSGPLRFHAFRTFPGPRVRLPERLAGREAGRGPGAPTPRNLYGHFTSSGQTSTPAIARTVRIPTVDGVAARAIRALDPQPRGVYCVDMKESADSQPKITEITRDDSSRRRTSSPQPG